VATIGVLDSYGFGVEIYTDAGTHYARIIYRDHLGTTTLGATTAIGGSIRVAIIWVCNNGTQIIAGIKTMISNQAPPAAWTMLAPVTKTVSDNYSQGLVKGNVFQLMAPAGSANNYGEIRNIAQTLRTYPS